MKKVFVVVVSLIVLLSFVGCEKADPDPYIPSTNTDAATTQITIEEGNIVARGESEFFKATITYFFEEGVYANPVLPPATPATECLIRTSYMATHTEALLDEAMDIIKKVLVANNID